MTFQSLDVGYDTPTGKSTFGHSVFTPTISGRGALALAGSGRGIVKLDEPSYIEMRRNELPTPGRSG